MYVGDDYSSINSYNSEANVSELGNYYCFMDTYSGEQVFNQYRHDKINKSCHEISNSSLQNLKEVF